MNEMMKRYEAETGKPGSESAEHLSEDIETVDYVRWLEAKANISDEAIEAFQEIIRNQCDEISALKENAESYGRIMSGGRKILKEWANIFGMVIAVDQNGEASCFVHVPVMYLDEGEGIWSNSPKHYGEETYLLPPHLIDFDGDWQDSLTLPDGWEDTKQNAQNVEESAMPYTKAPWKAVGVDDSYEIFDVAETYDIAWAIDSEANAKRIVACVNACKGITNEALEKGIFDDAIALVLNAGKDIGVTWDGMAPYYEGVKVWEEAK